jgi:hypothetical protein
LAVIIKGKSRGNGAQLGVYLITPADNERIEVLEIRGLAASDVPGAVIEMEAHAAGTRTEKPLYHASINPRANERLTEEQRAIAIDRLEAELGFAGQPRVVVLHQKEGRVQYHIVWDRIDLEHMRAISDSHNFRKHELVARELEREFGHERVQGAHVERDGKERPRRTPSQAEMLQEKRTGLSTKEVTEQVAALWRSADCGKAFAEALSQAGYVLARGDRRDFVIIDPRGGTHSLARRVDGARVKDIRARLSDLDPSQLPSVAEAKAIQRERLSREAERNGISREARTDGARETGREAPCLRSDRTHEKPGAGARAADGVARSAGSILDGIASIFERGLSGDASQTDLEKEARANEPPESQVEPSVLADEEQKSKRRQDLLREFGRELEDERDAEFERTRLRSR